MIRSKYKEFVTGLVNEIDHEDLVQGLADIIYADCEHLILRNDGTLSVEPFVDMVCIAHGFEDTQDCLLGKLVVRNGVIDAYIEDEDTPVRVLTPFFNATDELLEEVRVRASERLHDV